MQLNPEPKRLSPLFNHHKTMNASLNNWEGWLVPEAYALSTDENAVLRNSVGLVDISAKGKLTLKGTKADGLITANFGTIPTNRGDVIEVKSSQSFVAKLTPDEFLILTPPGREKVLATSLETEITSYNAFVSLIDQTSGLVGLLVSGPNSTGVMRKLCALDFNPMDFPNLHVAQSSFAKVRATIIRNDRENSPTFELYADRSYADYLWMAVLDAGMEFEIQPVGWKAVGI
jgi:heterotetrameric sarcosine oxidase gamma subunit